MGNSQPAHSFEPELTALCGEGETVQDKKQVNEIARAHVALKGKFGSGSQGRVGKLKSNGMSTCSLPSHIPAHSELAHSWQESRSLLG
jgi:hypothetical protein